MAVSTYACRLAHAGWLAVAALAAVTPGCSKPAPPPERPVVACASHDPSNELEVEVRPGDTLEAIAARRYGHRGYRHVISTLNRLGEPESLRAGARLRTPDLREALLAECADPALGPVVESICCARVKYAALSPTLARITYDHHQRPVAVPPEVAESLRGMKSDVDAAISGLRARRTRGASVPNDATARLQEVADALEPFARGEFDRLGYDIDMVDRRLAAAMSNLIVWARAGYR